MFDTSQLMAASGAAASLYDYTIDGSLRFNDDDSAYLSRTPASAGNRRTWTWSGWIKRGNLGYRTIFGTGDSPIGSTNNNLTQLYFQTDDTLRLLFYTSGTVYTSLATSQVFRDPSAWYHVVLSVDTTQATSSDRIKIYINGSQITDFSTSTYPSQNFDCYVNGTNLHVIGEYAGTGGGTGTYAWDGYQAEVNFIDGTALDATSFGEFKSGVWIPKAYSGSYGTNGFYLPLTSDANDASGNGNNWTANNLASTDYVLDSPTNNFATLNPLNVGASSATYAEGNLKVSTSSSNGIGGSSTIQIPSTGKWYAEFYYVSSSNLEAAMLGISPLASATRTYDWDETGSLGYYSGNGNKYIDGSGTAYGSSYTDGDVISILANSDSGEATYYKNGVSQGVITFDPANKLFYAGDGHGTTSITWVANFGQDSSFAGNKTAQGNTDDNGYGDFQYSVPSGYLALCTANLPDPVESMDPAQDGSPQDHFNTVLYTGNGSTQSITGVGFQPDFTWIKGRSYAHFHSLLDTIRGVGNRLFSNATNAESYSATSLTSFDTDGFSLGSTTTSNQSGVTFVAWNWKAGGSGVSNTDGSITSTVSANTDAGFSIVSYTGNKISGATIGHGLSNAPDMIIIKNRSQVAPQRWVIGHSGMDASSPWNYYLEFDTDARNVDYARSFNGTAPTSSVFSVGNDAQVNSTSDDFIAYCFHSVDGFSKFGYVPSLTNDAFIYLGFRPAFIMFKRTDDTSNWTMWDSTRSPYNILDKALNADTSNAEATFAAVDFVSNGVKTRSYTGVSGGWIYMAFAENPFKYANAR
jgi:hypothetical protein